MAEARANIGSMRSNFRSVCDTSHPHLLNATPVPTRRLQEVVAALEARAKMDSERSNRLSMSAINQRNKVPPPQTPMSESCRSPRPQVSDAHSTCVINFWLDCLSPHIPQLQPREPCSDSMDRAGAAALSTADVWCLLLVFGARTRSGRGRRGRLIADVAEVCTTPSCLKILPPSWQTGRQLPECVQGRVGAAGGLSHRRRRQRPLLPPQDRVPQLLGHAPQGRRCGSRHAYLWRHCSSAYLIHKRRQPFAAAVAGLNSRPLACCQDCTGICFSNSVSYVRLLCIVTDASPALTT